MLVASLLVSVPLTASGGATNGTFVPSGLDDERLPDAEALGGTLSGALDLGALTALQNNSLVASCVPTTPETAPYGYSSAPFAGYCYASAHWWGASSNGSLVGLLYNTSGNLVEVRGLLATGDGERFSATNGSYEAAARDLALSLGIADEDAPHASVVEEDRAYDRWGQLERLEMGVTLYGDVDGASVAGTNRIYVHFTNLEVTRFSLFPFREATLNATTSEGAAAQKVSDFVLEKFGPVRYVEVPHLLTLAWDQQHGSVAYLLRTDFVVPDDGAGLGETINFLVDPESGRILSYSQHDLVTNFNIGEPVPVTTLPQQDTVPWWLVFSIVVVVIGLTALLCWPPELVILALSSLSVLLYSRLKDDELLNNYRRGLIHGYIIAHPGASFSELRRSLDLPNGPLVYHLNVLEKSGLIKHRRVRNLVEYYGSDIDSRDATTLQLTDLQLNIVNVVGSMGTISRADLREVIRCSHQTLHYNLNKLVSLGVLEKKLQWGRWHFHLSPGIDAKSLRGRTSSSPETE
jgi:predicted transcriptional regulator